MMRLVIVAALASVPGAATAQSSAGYRLNEHALNAGGRPTQAITASSPGFRIRLDSIGGPMAGRGMTGAMYRLDAGFGAAHSPAGEVLGLEFLADHQTLLWNNEPASSAYNVYASPLSTLPGSFGICALSRVAVNVWTDPTTPSPGAGRFYLVTGDNRLWEEGTKGWTSGGAERGNPSPCP